MSELRPEILPHTSGWIFKLKGVESAPYPTEQLALKAAKTAAFRYEPATGLQTGQIPTIDSIRPRQQSGQGI